jgi:XRE family transcriptional regulator, regulator of sulfur utilization
MAPTPRQLGMKLQAFRVQKGMSQAALAAKAKLTREHINRLEAGRHGPTLAVLQRLAKALGVSVPALLE